MNFKLTQDTVRYLVSYDPGTGLFTVNPGRQKQASVITTHDGVHLRLYRRYYRADCVALFIATGKWPGAVVWHHDRDPFNLRLSNLSPLRDALKGPNPE